MTKLEELKQQVAEAFEKAEDKATIEKLAAINNSIDAVAAEQQSIEEKNAELIKSYKDLVKHTSFKDESTKPTETVPSGDTLSFEEALQEFMSKKK